jgi:hypothetical protein
MRELAQVFIRLINLVDLFLNYAPRKDNLDPFDFESQRQAIFSGYLVAN